MSAVSLLGLVENVEKRWLKAPSRKRSVAAAGPRELWQRCRHFFKSAAGHAQFFGGGKR
jgi:hypothetical protein